MLNKHFFPLISIALLFVVFACKTSQEITTNKLKPKGAREIYRSLNTDKDFEWLVGKMQIDFTDGEQNRSFSANYKMLKDSIIWISIAPALGIELFRVTLMPDSVIVLDKINRKYFSGNISKLGDKFNADLDFQNLQDLILGIPVRLNESERYKAEVQGNRYIFKNIPSRKLRKGLGILKEEDFSLPPDSIYLYEVQNKKIKKSIRKDDEVYVKRFILSQDLHYKGAYLMDIEQNRLLEITYSKWQSLEGSSLVLPIDMTLDMSDLKGSMKLHIEIVKLRAEKEQKLTVRIPSGYERQEL